MVSISGSLNAIFHAQKPSILRGEKTPRFHGTPRKAAALATSKVQTKQCLVRRAEVIRQKKNNPLADD